MNGRPWRTSEETILVEMWNGGTGATEIGRALGRSPGSVNNHIHMNRKRLGLIEHESPKWHPAEKRLIARELEAALTRISYGCPHRRRPALTQQAIAYLYGEAKRRKVRVAAARIEDLGGMAVVGASTHPFGTPRGSAKRGEAA